jgi:hypothetical protein
VFGKFSVQVPPGIPAALEEVFCGFLQSPQVNTRCYFIIIIIIIISIPVTGRGDS